MAYTLPVLSPCAYARLNADTTRSPELAPATRDDRGYIHSLHTGSVVDGPGMRTVIWTNGCLLRCVYCHNPDTWHMKHGTIMSIDEVMDQILRYRRFMEITKGGVTISGGEPLVQAPFVSRILRECKREGIHTALDTNGVLTERLSNDDLEAVDLVLLDIKSWEPETHLRVTGHPVEPVLSFAQRLSDLGKRVWIRYVLVPGLTDEPANVDGLAAFVASLRSVERVEILPFHQMGRTKWKQLGLEYTLSDTMPANRTDVKRVQRQFLRYGIEAR
jgi:pyruvate formate lyase activating enzyme